MTDSALDTTALGVAILAAIAIAASMILAHRGDNPRRGWLVAGAMTLALSAIAALDLLRESPHETHLSGIVAGMAIAVLGSLGLVRGTRRVRPWVRWPLTAVVAFTLLLGGLLFGATYVSRLLPF